MTRGLLIGILLGSTVGAFLGALWGRSRGNPPPVSEAVAPHDRPPDPRIAETESLRTELGSARSQIETLKLELDAVRKLAATAPTPGKVRPAWAALQPRIAAAIESGRLRDEDDPVFQGLMIDALSLLQDLAKEKSVTLAEALASPDGWPALVAAYLENVDPPLSNAQRGLLAESLASCRRDWDIFAARRESLTGLEIVLEAGRLADSFDTAVSPLVGKEHHRAVDDMGELVEDIHPSRVIDRKINYETSDEELRSRWESEWTDILTLRAGQRSKLGPILDEYIRDQDVLQRAKSGEEKKIALMNAVQRKILDTLDLDAGQTAALRGWTIVYERDPR